MSPSVDAAELSQALREMNRQPNDPRLCPFPDHSGLAEAWRRGYVDDRGNSIKGAPIK